MPRPRVGVIVVDSRCRTGFNAGGENIEKIGNLSAMKSEMLDRQTDRRTFIPRQRDTTVQCTTGEENEELPGCSGLARGDTGSDKARCIKYPARSCCRCWICRAYIHEIFDGLDLQGIYTRDV